MEETRQEHWYMVRVDIGGEPTERMGNLSWLLGYVEGVLQHYPDAGITIEWTTPPRIRVRKE